MRIWNANTDNPDFRAALWSLPVLTAAMLHSRYQGKSRAAELLSTAKMGRSNKEDYSVILQCNFKNIKSDESKWLYKI